MFIRVGFITSMVIKKLHSFKRNMINNFLLGQVCPPSWTLAECWLGRDLVPGSHRFTSAGECKEMGTSANFGNCIGYLISYITPQCHSKLWVRSNRGRKRIGGFVSARPWVETGARWIALLLAGYQVWPHLLSRSLSGTRSWMTPCRSSGRLASSPCIRLTKAWLKEYSTYIHAHITNFTFNFSVATS